ncbi:HSP90 family protein [Gleimia sp. 6138-11-ORH1]|uniref:HSP90 family protein n=1 Tax=Gleimia sp. 6138-11-ORH1 TaxID=2973937 RepID=UPI00216885C7|nr:HSP90 family protein [Gleimia sp. 6138-11-ORH1]MCS4484294.1 HSP90 family protein [Gleimia sp. 6138-11-ORH1]
MSNRFQVNLTGLVEVLSRNLYSGPKVFVRELLQNGFDAITARQKLDPNCAAQISFRSYGDKKLVVSDTGIGLTLEQAKDLLASIGATSKRDELGLARTEFIGQFGIGLLSCFMVTQTIVVYSQNAETVGAPIICWKGYGDGTWDVSVVSEAEVPAEFNGPGTTIILEATGAEPLFNKTALVNLVLEYGAHLPVSITVADEISSEQLGAAAFPWELELIEQEKWCSANFGFHPFAKIPLQLGSSQTVGMAFVLPEGAHPGQSLKHHVYVQNMLVSKTVTNLVPDWAYFVRVVVDSKFLKPTASRESLFDDELLEEVKESIGETVRGWLVNLSNQDMEKFVKFMRAHIVGMKALSVHDQQTREMLKSSIPYETTLGFFTLEEIINRTNAIIYTQTKDDFRAIEAVAAAQEILVINGGYAFDEQVFAQLKLDYPQVEVREVKVSEILAALESLPVTEEINFITFLEYASQALASQKVDVVIRNFLPASLPMVYLPQPGGAGREIEKKAQAQATGAFAGLIGHIAAAAPAESRSQVVFNGQSSVVNQLANLADPQTIELAVRGFFVQAILNGHHPMTPEVKQWSTQVFAELISRQLTANRKSDEERN